VAVAAPLHKTTRQKSKQNVTALSLPAARLTAVLHGFTGLVGGCVVTQIGVIWLRLGV
jgi:hypothetical protein